MSVRVRTIPGAIDELAESREMVAMLREVAGDISGRVRAPSHLTVSTRAGVGPRGAFAQVIMSGPGALTEEFGNSSRGPKAPLRRAIGGR